MNQQRIDTAALRAGVDIAQVIGSYVQLRKDGAEYKGCCPFHNERTPSFYVSPAKQFYHCFGCGAHGDVIGFLQAYESLTFAQACERLPVRTDGNMQVEHITAMRDQIWAEAVVLFGQGFKWWELPEDAAEEQEDRYIGDSWEGRAMRWLSGKATGDNAYPPRMGVGWGAPAEWTTTDEVLRYALGIEPGKHGRPEQMRIAAVLKRLRWEQRRTLVDGYRERRWYRRDPLPATAQPVQAGRISAGGGDDPPF